ncbi:MAG: family 10 glycosylhydrolase [Clostridia bacterium]|nr:family 10 glycosylhydrolase [Clostridia bacterium]
MKRIICLILTVVILLSGCTVHNEEQENIPETDTTPVSAVWIYYDELSMIKEKGGTEKSFRKKMQTMLDNCVSWGINTVFLQVRPCADSFYESEIFPWTHYMTGEQGKSVPYDPLAISVEEAHKRNISLHAWINPFRIAFSDDLSKLSENHPALKWIEEKSGDVVFVNDGIYFSPASLEVQKLVTDGVREIINNYDVDGIHIDDYFYPSTEEKVDSVFYKKYTADGGKLNLDKWRLSTISAFVSSLYNAVKSEDEDCVFSISPAGNIQNNYEQQYADVKLWCKENGYADWIIPQLYYGFESKPLPFDKAMKQWEDIHKNDEVKMIYGLAAYRVNEEDEWKAGNGIIKKQLNLIENESSACGVACFSYSSLADEKRKAEFEGLF